mmetsp:Transcript_37443/g.99529  ORF Transcript_37443/g.99529 Transcript_37443/m.99529 type:complete len:137 (+) Transcript_37443:56-466(+)|eukprot:CAMPEP_0194531736 /NCGR_PEP_ID=MMETSP0253-20130528/69110_1 /TAXON_ID=2966 /ORGANISM="Noctiluca scintillans" /LENGTH=136 /DNA_ID=CAMNT_0039377115 /DNA_START=13 /DNA_END=423 /DNA_ORIENTATION=+
MWTKPPPEVSCISSSVESFFRGSVAGGIFGVVFRPQGLALVAQLASPLRPALLAGSWCFLTSFASCVLTRAGMPFPLNAASSGLFSGSVIGLVSRWPADAVRSTMVCSGVLSVISHYGAEGHSAPPESAKCSEFDE